MRRRIVLHLRPAVKRRLTKRLREARDAGEMRRIQIVLLYAQGKGAVKIARALGCGVSTATRVARKYLAAGELAIEDGRRSNGRSVIDDDLCEALRTLLRRTPEHYGWSRPSWTTELLRRVLAQETGVEVSRRTVGRMLHAIGARWGSPKPVVACPWPESRRKRRLRRIRRLLRNLRPDEVAYYADEVDIHLNPRIGRDWMLPGTQKLVLTPGRNEKRYLAGALSPDGRRLVYATWDRKTSDLFVLLLRKLQEAHPEARHIHLILDNCAMHSSKKVWTFIACQGELFRFHFLPPYCPDHNKIERFWRDLHANVTRNHRCRTINQLMRNVHKYMRHEACRRRRKSNAQARVRILRNKAA